MGGFAFDRLKFSGEDDGHDDAVDGHDFAEDDRDQVLRSYPRGLDAAAEDRGAGDEDSPVPQPLFSVSCFFRDVWTACCAYHAAPTTDSPMQRPIPRSAHAYGDTLSRNAPTCGCTFNSSFVGYGSLRRDWSAITNIEGFSISSEQEICCL